MRLNDGYHDNAPGILRHLLAEYDRTRAGQYPAGVWSMAEKVGYQAGIRHALAYASGYLSLTTDGDFVQLRDALALPLLPGDLEILDEQRAREHWTHELTTTLAGELASVQRPGPEDDPDDEPTDEPATPCDHSGIGRPGCPTCDPMARTGAVIS